MSSISPHPEAGPAEAVYELSAGPYQSGELRVLSFEGREEMNGLYAFDVMAWGRDIDENMLETCVIGVPAVLVMNLSAVASRVVRGVVSSVVLEGRREGGRHAFRLTIVPRMWLLQKRVNSRIFQDKTVRQMVETILVEHDIAHAFHLLARYPSRQYCVQYQETDYHFLTRILAEEGIFFFFEQPAGDGDDARELLICADSAHSYPSLEGDPGLIYREQHGEGSMNAEETHVTDFRARMRVESSSVLMRDYDFQRPLLDLSGGAGGVGASIGGTGGSSEPDAAGSRRLEVYDHHGEYEETDADTNSAGVYLEQLRAGAREAHGSSVCRRLLPGHRFDLSDHDLDKLNAAYVVTEVEHKGVAAEAALGRTRIYENRFRCVPAEVPFRPSRPPRVLKQVTESALVVGPEGQEIFTDSYGRIKVQFHWDREGKRNAYSSCWMRVAQAWAGAGWGFQFIPRIGMEVLVSFLGGDQDRPVVVGCLYNAQNPVAQGLPSQATRSGIRSNSTPGGGGSNELTFDDRAGSEQLYIHAERNLDEEVGRDRSALVRGSRVETVENDARSVVRGARSEETLGDATGVVGGTRAVVVGGADTLRVSGLRSAEIGGSDGVRVAANLELEVGGARKEQIGKSDRLVVEGDRTTVVHGDDTRVVGANARTVLGGSASLTIAGGVAIAVGSSSMPAPADGQISGDLRMKCGGTIDLSAAKSIRFRVGKTVVTIGPDTVEIEADTITLSARSIEGKSDKASLSMGEAVEISGKTVKIFSEDKAILELDKEAKLDGQAVKIKPGLAAEMKKSDERQAQAKDLPKVKIHLFDRKGKAIPDAPYEVSFFGYLDEGTSADGTVELPAFPDIEKAHVRWGRPKAQREYPDDPDPYEFEMDVFLVVDHADEEEAFRRKLYNLGHQGEELYEAVNKLQAALGVDRTGAAADVKDEVESRHGCVKPVEIDTKEA